MPTLNNAMPSCDTIPRKPIEKKDLCTPDKVYIPENVKKDMEKIESAVRNRERFGGLQIRGVLLSGAKGTGKTLAAQALAHKLDAVFIPLVTLANEIYIRRVFEEARKLAEGKETGGQKGKEGQRLVILFSDELDSVSQREDLLNAYEKRAANALITELDGIGKNQNILFMGTSNHPDEIDDALRRPGRLDYEINFLPPQKEGRIKILEIHAEKYDTSFIFNIKDDFPKIAELTPGFTGADLRKLLQDAMVNINWSIEHDHGNKVPKERDDGKGKIIANLDDLMAARQGLKPSAFSQLHFFETQKKKENLGGYRDQIALLEHMYGNIDDGTIGLIYGPAGTGKTDIPAIIAKSMGLNVLVFNAGEFLDMYVGKPNKMIGRALKIAETTGHTVVILDELQSIIERKGEENHLSDITHFLLSELSQPKKGVVIIATATRPDRWEQQLTDRFIYKLLFPNPKEGDRKEIWEKYLPDELKGKAADLAKLELNARRIERISQKCKQFGVSEFEKYHALAVKTSTASADREVDYEDLKNKLGDDTEDFGILKGK